MSTMPYYCPFFYYSKKASHGEPINVFLFEGRLNMKDKNISLTEKKKKTAQKKPTKQTNKKAPTGKTQRTK